MSKEKKYFIITSVVIILISIYSIVNVNSIMKSMLESASSFQGAFGERMITILSKKSFYIGTSAISIVVSLITLAISYKNKISDLKGLLIILGVILFLSSSNSIVSILSIVNIIVSANVKRTAREKKDIPELERYTNGFIGMILAIVCFAVYFSRFLFSARSYLLSFIIYYSILFIIVILFWDNLKRDFKVFKKSYKEYISFVLPKIGIVYIIYFVVSVISALVNKNISVNQQEIEALPIWYVFPLAVTFAPVVEEILFRGCIRRFIKNDILFIFISGLLFGLLHTISEGSVLTALFMAIPYSTLGCGLAYIYAKTNNITNNILVHASHNFVVMLIQIILL